jgi:dGTPase
MEHVAHVESVSSTIANYLGLNVELTKAISLGHDIGHAPFGHQGETVIDKLSQKYLKKEFWHEQNGLRFVDKIELLEDQYKRSRNLDLTYAVRDGIISHCGEIDENGIAPRSEFIDLNTISSKGQYQPISWEGCVMKISDKIAYLGRDIEDAVRLGFINQSERKLQVMASEKDHRAINTTTIIYDLISDICENSTPEKGICLSSRYYELLNSIKKFNYDYIYKNNRLMPFKKYSEMIISQIFSILLERYDKKHTIQKLKDACKIYPTMIDSFTRFLIKYCYDGILNDEDKGQMATFDNEKIYSNLDNRQIYIQAILDFISGMSDRFAIKVFEELITY